MLSRRHRKLTVSVKPNSAKCKKPLTAPASRMLGERWTRYRIVNGTLKSLKVTGNRQGNLLQPMILRVLQQFRHLNTEEGEAEQEVEVAHREVVGAGVEGHLQPVLLALGLWILLLRLQARLPPSHLRNLRQLALLHNSGPPSVLCGYHLIGLLTWMTKLYDLCFLTSGVVDSL